MPVSRFYDKALMWAVQPEIFFGFTVVGGNDAAPVEADDRVPGIIMPVAAANARSLLNVKDAFYREGKYLLNIIHYG